MNYSHFLSHNNHAFNVFFRLAKSWVRLSCLIVLFTHHVNHVQCHLLQCILQDYQLMRFFFVCIVAET